MVQQECRYVGLAIYDGKKFLRYSNVPILETEGRSLFDNTLSILREKIFKMWYDWRWMEIGKQTYPKYNIKFAHSFDGINWIRKGKISVDYENKSEHALAKPSVIKVGKKYVMFFCSKKYKAEYKLQTAISSNGKKWKRLKNFNFSSLKKEKWENQMHCYPHVIKFKIFICSIMEIIMENLALV